MSLPEAAFADQQDVVSTSWGTLQTAVSDANNARLAVAADAAVVVTKQAAYDAALATWVGAGSPESGAEFDAKEAALAELVSAQGAYTTDANQLAAYDAVLATERRGFGVAVAEFALIQSRAEGYNPDRFAVFLADLFAQVGIAIAPTF
jgi:hypothetical protein